MLVMNVNRILNWVQVTNGWGCYTCPMQEIGGELFFHFKGQWHNVFDYLSEHAIENVLIEGNAILREMTK